MGIGNTPVNVSGYKTLELGTEGTTVRGRIKVNTAQDSIILYGFESGSKPYLGLYSSYGSGTYIGRFDDDGLKFGNASAAANALDDYEEGTWTPTSSSNISSISNVNGHYTKIGNVVTAMFRADITPTSASSNVQLGGLPYAVADKLTGTNVEGTGVIFEDSNLFMFWAQGASSTIVIELDRPLQGSADTTNRSYRGSLSYFTS